MTIPNSFRNLRRLAVFALIGFMALPILAAHGQALGQSGDVWKNIAVFSLTSTDEGAPLIKQIINATGHEGLLDDFEQQQREEFETLDFSQPKGIVCQTNGRTFQFLGFAAMTDVTELPYGIGELIDDAKTDRDGWHKIAIPGANQMPLMFQNVYVKQQGDWGWFCYGCLRPPKGLPDDPTEWLEGLPDEYPAAFRLNCAAVPQGQLNGIAMIGKQFLPMLKMFMPLAHGDEEQQKIMAAYFDFLEVVLSESIDQTVKFINETETVTLGLSGNDDDDLFLTMQVVAKPGTDTAESFQLAENNTTDLIGFYRPDESIISYVFAMQIPDYEKEFLKKTYIGTTDFFNVLLDTMRQQAEEYGPDEAPEAFDKIEALLAKLPTVIEKTFDAGKLDLAVNVTNSGLNLYAFKLAGGNELLEPANELFDFAQMMILQEMTDMDEDPASAPVLERETYEGVQLWHISIPLPRFMIDEDQLDDEERMVIAYVFGLSDELFIYSGGMFAKPGEVLAMVKECIDASGEAEPMPEEWMVFSPYNCAQMYKRLFGVMSFRGYDDDDDEMSAEERDEEFDNFWDIPEDANMTATFEIDENVMTQTFRIDGGIWPTVGKIIEKAIEESDSEILAPFAPFFSDTNGSHGSY